MTLEEVRNALKDQNLAKVAAESGVTYPRVLRFVSGKTRHPSHEIVTRLTRYAKSLQEA